MREIKTIDETVRVGKSNSIHDSVNKEEEEEKDQIESNACVVFRKKKKTISGRYFVCRKLDVSNEEELIDDLIDTFVKLRL